MARDGVPQARPSGPGQTTGERTIAARHAAEATAPLDEPDWLREDIPPDPEEETGTWAELHRIIQEAEAAQADEDAARARLVAAGLELGYAHVAGKPGHLNGTGPIDPTSHGSTPTGPPATPAPGSASP